MGFITRVSNCRLFQINNVNRGGPLLAHTALVVVCILATAPFAWMLLTSLKTRGQRNRVSATMDPNPIKWSNYLDVFKSGANINFLLWTHNTLVITLLTVLARSSPAQRSHTVLPASKFKGRGALFVIMLATMMIPFPVVMSALFTLFRCWVITRARSGLAHLNRFWVPAWFGSAFNIFLLRQFFITIPKS